MIDTPQIVPTDARITAKIRLTVPRADIRNVMEPGIKEVINTLAAQGIAPAGPLFTHHLRVDPDIFDFEICVPVTTPVVATGRVQPGHLPAAAKVARTVYHGPYEQLGEAWGKFINWIVSNGHTPAADLWESYVTGPESSPDPATWRTELYRPLI